MIQQIRLQHFRSYGDASFEFQPGVNIVVGPNASGKTNLLEALLVVASGNSYRARDVDLVSHEETWSRLDALADNVNRTVKITAEPRDKQYEIAGRTYTRLTLSHALPVVLFEPEHLSLAAGSPERRRDYLDTLLAQTVPGFATTMRSYRRTLAQRNHLLRSGASVDAHFFPWDVRLSELGGQIVRERTRLAQQLAEPLPALYREIAGVPTNVTVHYLSAAPPVHYESVMLRELERRRTDDIIRGFTSFGPHRDDLVMMFDGSPAAEVASRGELRTLVLCLKIMELKLLETMRPTAPLLLLDDVFSELDGARRQALTAHLAPYQTFITTTDADIIAHHFADHTNVILTTHTE